jgi:hypothetical protein
MSGGLTIRVDDGEDVEVIVVQGAPDNSIVVLVAQNKLVGEILDGLSKKRSDQQDSMRWRKGEKGKSHRSSQPFTSMDVAVPDDGLLASGSTPEVNTTNGTTLHRVADGEEAGVAGESSLQIGEERLVLGQRVVGVEVGDGRDGSSGGSLGLEGG